MNSESETGPVDGRDYRMRVVDDPGRIPREDWNRLAGAGRSVTHPFTDHRYLCALSESGSVGGDMFAGLFELAVDARYLVPLSAHWTAYARGRVMSARLDRGGGVGPVGADGPAPTDRYAVATDRVGRGLGGGLGLSVGGDVRALGFLFWPLFFTSVGPTVHASVFVERSTDLYRLHGRWDSADVIAERWTLGLGIGKDF